MADLVYALLHKGKTDYGISFPDFPGCVSGGKTPEEALTRGRETLAFHVGGMLEDGLAIPRLHSLDELRADPELREDFEDSIVALVPVELPGKSTRINISIDDRLLERIDDAAKAVGETRSAFLARAAKERLAS
ncbi:MAG: ribbon-helix-helix protein, CopG family [Beijerinckiaceae bacterium]|nr:MAG: ribbon-helix-helix protein, CopG family [Beijerinckiaceae bacterium]